MKFNVDTEGMDALKNRLTSENLCQQKSRISQRWEWTLCLAGCPSLPEICRGIVCRTTRQKGEPQRVRDCRDEIGPGIILEYHIHCCFVNVFRIMFPFVHPIGPIPILHTYARIITKWWKHQILFGISYCWWKTEDILHLLIGSLSMFIPLFTRFHDHPRWLALGFLPSTVSCATRSSLDFLHQL